VETNKRARIGIYKIRRENQKIKKSQVTFVRLSRWALLALRASRFG